MAHSQHNARERSGGHGALLPIAIVLALGIGLGVPLLWVWIGSKLQGSGASTVDSTTAAVIFAGIVITYVAILFAIGFIQGHTAPDDGRAQPRYPWNRSMRDEPYRHGERRLTTIESAFVFTAILVSGAFLFWFFAFAGSPIPHEPTAPW